tara:strand:- start:5524 stop:6675 length:1152 start_codon:yes stop_codon:yes gene_type:complete
MFFKLIFFILIISLLIDLAIKIVPKSKLNIYPIKYILKKRNNFDEIECYFEIRNLSKKKEIMIPNLSFNLDLISERNFEDFQIKKEIIIDDGIIKKKYNNYWQTIIIKARSNIKIYLKIKLKNYFDRNKFIWLKVNWENYGDFGLISKQNCFLLNDYTDRKSSRELNIISLSNEYDAVAIKTNILGSFDNPLNTIKTYCQDIIKQDDILIIGETPLAIMQGRYVDSSNINCNIFSKILCYFFHPTSSLATACGMQLLINKIGFTRIFIALLIGFSFKIIGIKGMFYRLTGVESSLIDDISGTTIPYDKSIVLGPKNSKSICNEISKVLNIEAAVVDVNDLGGVKILASSSKNINKRLMTLLKKNPAGNDDQKTPIVLIRKKDI